MTVARTPAEVLAGEAASGTSQQRWNDMLNIASVMVNRAAMLGVSLDDVVSVQNQFNAYNRQMPPGTQSLVDMAQAAIDQVQEQGPVNNATFYATPTAVGNLPNGLVVETETAGHQFFSDPAMRAIQTAVGSIRPDPNALPSLANQDPIQKAINGPYEANGLLNGITSLTQAPVTHVTSTAVPAGQVDPSFQPSGLLSGNFPASSFTPSMPTLNNWADLAAAGPPPQYPDLQQTGLLGSLFEMSPSQQQLTPAASPVDATATGALGAQPDLSASATAVPSIRTPTVSDWGDLAAAGPIAAPVASPMTNVPPTGDGSVAIGRVVPSTPSQRMGLPVSDWSQLAAAGPVQPALSQPAINSWSDLAASGPIQAPVSVQGILGQMNQPNLAASASVPASVSLFSPTEQKPSVDVSATGILGVNPALSASTAVNPMASVPATADLGTTPALAAQTAAVPSVKTPALNSFADLAAAGPVQSTQPSQFGDINSPEMQAMKASAAAQLAGMKPITATATNNSFASLAEAGPVASPVSVTPTGILGTTPALTASATATPVENASVTERMGVLSSLQPTQTPTASETAINGILGQSPSLLSSTAIGNQVPNLSAVTPSASMLANSVTPNYQQYQSFVPSDVQPTTVSAPAVSENLGISTPDYQAIVAQSFPSTVDVAQDPAASTPSLPSLDTVSVADQPAIAGPMNTPAVAQQAVTSTPTKTGLLGGLVNKGTLTGGLLGGVVAGPVGGILGGLLGNQISRNGGLTGLLGGAPMSINNIGSGLMNVASVYGGAPIGTQANTNNGGFVTSLGGGWTAYTNPYGVTTTEGPNGLHASYFGPSLTGDNGSPGVSGEPGGNSGYGYA